MINMNKSIFWIASATTLLLVGCKKEQAPMTEVTKPYPTVDVPTKSVVGYYEYPVQIQGTTNNDVRAKISGYITQVLVDEGAHVSVGQPLFRLETNTLNDQAQAAKSGVAAEQSAIGAAQASVNAAQVEVNKLKPLVQKGVISSVQLETAMANLFSAQSRLKQAQASHQQAIANYNGVQSNIGYSVIRSPINGTVGKLNLRVGSLVGPMDPTPLTTVSETHNVYAYFAMNEKDYLDFLQSSYGATMSEKLTNLPPVELVLANGKDYSEKGRVEAVTGQVNQSTGTVQFRALFPNPIRLLSNGNSGKIKIPKFYNDVLVVPEAATYEQQGMVYIYKVEKDKVKPVAIKVKDRVNNMIIVEEGLKKGDKVVVSGINTLKPDMKIIPQPAKFDSIVKPLKPML